MGFVAIAVGISIDACGRQAMPTVVTERLVSGVEPCRSVGYAYPEICSIKTLKMNLISPD
jgi:hypothetical protein